MRLWTKLGKMYWKTKLTLGVLKKRTKAKTSYRKLLKDERKGLYADIKWNCLIIDWRVDEKTVNYLGKQLKSKEIICQNSVVVRNYDSIMGYMIEIIKNQEQMNYKIPSYQNLKLFLDRVHIEKIYVNELFGYDNLYEILNLLMELKNKNECKLFYLMHDYYCIYPRLPQGIKEAEYNLLKFAPIWCKKDTNCYENREVQDEFYGWKEHWKVFLKRCDMVITFSQIVKEHIQQIYHGLSVQVVLCQDIDKLKKGDAFEKTENVKDGVSICIPAYNNGEYVKRLLISIQIQTYLDYEVIITDDSSNWEVEKVVAEFSASMPIRYYRNCLPLGPTQNNNRAISLAKRKYVKIMHHDDWFARPDSLEQFVFLLEEHSEADLAFSGDIGFGQGRGTYEHIKRDQANQLEKDWRNLFLGNWIGAPSVTIFRNKGWLFDENLVWCVDFELYMRMLSENSRFVYTELPLIYLGTSDTQLTKSCREDKKLMYDEQKYVYRKYKMYTNFRLWNNYMAKTIKYKLGSKE